MNKAICGFAVLAFAALIGLPMRALGGITGKVD